MMSCGWLWLYVGVFMMFLELLSPGFVIFFFGLAAAAVGLLRLLIGESFTAIYQVSFFTAFSIIFLVLLRRWLKSLFLGRSEESRTDFENSVVGRAGKVTEAITPPLAGRVEIGDAQWNATSSVPLQKDDVVKVVSQENLTLVVERV